MQPILKQLEFAEIPHHRRSPREFKAHDDQSAKIALIALRNDKMSVGGIKSDFVVWENSCGRGKKVGELQA